MHKIILALVFTLFVSAPLAAQESQLTLRLLLSKIESLQSEVNSLKEELATLKGTKEQQAVLDEKPAISHTTEHTKPEFNLTGDLVGSMSTLESGEELSRDDFALREAELEFEAHIAPDIEAVGIFAHDGDNFAVEEVYLEFAESNRRPEFKLGKFKAKLGLLNQWHPHAWPQVDASFVHQYIAFNADLIGAGLSAEVTTRKVIGDETAFTFQIMYPDDSERAVAPAMEALFSANEEDTPIKLARLQSKWTKAQQEIQIGVSSAWGHSDPQQRYEARLYGLDFTLECEDRFLLRGEWFRLEEEQGGPQEVDRSGYYLYAEKQITEKSLAGLRWDKTDFREQANLEAKGLSPYFTFWQNEQIRYRLQYTREERSDGVDDSRLLFQTTFSLGHHEHDH